MEALEGSVGQAVNYPCNLLYSDTSAFLLHRIRLELFNQADRIFGDASDACVDFLEVPCGGYGEPRVKCVRNDDDLQKALDAPRFQEKAEIVCRLIFIHAPTARDKLYITLQMFQRILSYHQVMSSFAESVFSFGFREHSEECNTTTFQSCNRLSDPQRGLEVPQLHRSGFAIEHCYGLRSVETSTSRPSWPWSIRQASIYHSLDLESAQATWIVIKANKLIEKLARDATAPSAHRSKLQRGGVIKAIAAAMEIHGQIALWSGSNWQWYISFMESQVQEASRAVLAVTMEEEVIRVSSRQLTETTPAESPMTSPFETDEDPKAIGRKRTSLNIWPHRVRSFGVSKKHRAADKRDTLTVSRHRFSFKDLPRVQYLEEKANEALDVLENNDEVLENLKQDYAVVVASIVLEEEADDPLEHFVTVISNVQKRLRVQRTRVKQLLRLLADRKAMLQSVLNYESMEANRFLAEKASVSAKKMEDISDKTKLETVSMRIITLVTLFFLPGTFISTLMSTPIVTFAPGSPSTSDSNISTGALGFYCAVSLPLVTLTFASWYLVYWWETRREQRMQAKLSQAAEPP